ncbi:hypothetical protein RAS12_06445 [Achromobacter seleniivolatilans]|uniref:Uncharacterized protein n=1 Tax=Achromobacter seleniivolatilans TaxID=3047478 RepID=A0ABY9M4U0_9BURK|nr:hypothetical protein [Achromobacter sp. R39]WMD22011.1 hypothetical protein RAS12_06445 [Achromobacter sp. R39]
MKNRAMTCAFVLVTGLAAAGSAMAQSAAPTTPTNTPNDSTAAQPNRALPAGQMAPAPNATPSTGTTPAATHSGTMSSGKKHADETPKRPREANDNVPRTPAAGAAPPPGYPNSGGSK